MIDADDPWWDANYRTGPELFMQAQRFASIWRRNRIEAKRARRRELMAQVEARTVRGPDFTLVCCSAGRRAQAEAIAARGLHAGWECPLCINGT